jgi:D-xylose transport system ATP-binding protein
LWFFLLRKKMAENIEGMSASQQADVAVAGKGTPVLRLKGVGKTYGAVRALQGVDLEVYAGEVIGLVGDNGAGKSTLVKTISGVGPADEGEFYVSGQRVDITSPTAATRQGIETVYQDLALCDNLDVTSNLFLGHEMRTPYGTLNNVEMEKRAINVLRTLDVKIPSARALVSALSGGQRQSIAVAKTILRDAKLVMLDEPTAALGVAQTRQVLNLIKRLSEQGLAVIVISHNMVDVFEVADRVVVMRLGHKVATFNVKGTSSAQVVAAITGAEFGPTTPEDAPADSAVGGEK